MFRFGTTMEGNYYLRSLGQCSQTPIGDYVPNDTHHARSRTSEIGGHPSADGLRRPCKVDLAIRQTQSPGSNQSSVVEAKDEEGKKHPFSTSYATLSLRLGSTRLAGVLILGFSTGSRHSELQLEYYDRAFACSSHLSDRLGW